MAFAAQLSAAGCAQDGSGTHAPSESEQGQPSSPEPATPEVFAWRPDYVPAEGVGEFAIISHGARLLVDARDDAAEWIVDYGRPGVVKIVSRSEGFVEIQLDWVRDEQLWHCWGAPFFHVGLRMFVREDQLRDLIVHAVSIELGEGRWVNVAPGVIAQAEGDEVILETYVSYLNHLSLRLPLDQLAAHIGKFYVPVRADSLPVVLDSLVGGGALDYGAREHVFDYAWVYARDLADASHVVVGESCMQVAGYYEPRDYHHGASGGGGCGYQTTRWWKIEAGTQLRWADGRAAGQAYREIVSTLDVDSCGTQRCFELAFDCESSPMVCVDAGDIVEVPSPLPSLVMP